MRNQEVWVSYYVFHCALRGTVEDLLRERLLGDDSQVTAEEAFINICLVRTATAVAPNIDAEMFTHPLSECYFHYDG